jgi:hypothetical protein
MSDYKYISDNEIDGNVKDKLLKLINGFIRCLRSIFYIHYFVKGEHSEDSYHLEGKAADGHKGEFRDDRQPNMIDVQIMASNLRKIIDKKDKSLFEQAIIARLRGLSGIGIYPHWKPIGGLHLDIRDEPLCWLGLSKDKVKKELEDQEGKQVYFYLN